MGCGFWVNRNRRRFTAELSLCTGVARKATPVPGITKATIGPSGRGLFRRISMRGHLRVPMLDGAVALVVGVRDGDARVRPLAGASC